MSNPYGRDDPTRRDAWDEGFAAATANAKLAIDALEESLDGVTAMAETLMAHYGDAMPAADRAQRLPNELEEP